MSDDYKWEPLKDRIERFVSTVDLGAILDRQRAIVAPNAEKMSADAKAACELIQRGKIPSPIQQAAFEQMIRLHRPAPLVSLDNKPPDSEAITRSFPDLPSFRMSLRKIHSSIGRIERVVPVSSGSTLNSTPIGTGFLATAELLVTALHVVDVLTFSTRRLERGQAIIDFNGLRGITGTQRHDIIEIVAIDTHADLAALKIERKSENGFSLPMIVHSENQRKFGSALCVVGFPMQIDEDLVPEISRITFGDQLGVKRFAPGELIGHSDQGFFHDCSTLRGNSGSPIFDMATSTVCGVHVSGRALLRNAAAGVAPLRKLLDSLYTTVHHATYLNKQFSKSTTMADGKPDFEAFMQRLQNNDPEITEELREAKKTHAQNESTEDHKALLPETIVLTRGRPVLDIKQGDTIIKFDEIESEVWRTRLTDSAVLLMPGIPAVGRIELSNDPRGIRWLGTGWLIRDNIVVTNRHVAEAFAENSGGEFRFLPGFDGSPIRSNIDFLEEFGSDQSAEFPIFRVIHIEKKSGPDIAFLRIEPVHGNDLPNPVSIEGGSVATGDQVAVIGYPARDDFFPYPEIMDRIFGSRYDKKRLAPGLITESGSQRLFHDCSTLGGNSGGKIVSLKTGKAVGLHFAGTLFATNHAVPMPVVMSTLERILRRPASSIPKPTSVKETSASSRTIEATIPIRIRIELGDVTPATVTSNNDLSTLVTRQVLPPDCDFGDSDEILTTESRVEDYANRDGYDSAFLGDGFEVPLPKLTSNRDDRVTFELDGKSLTILDYRHFSVVMSRRRRMCRFSACNIDGKNSKRKRRTGWRTDPRIPAELQIIKECYGNAPKFSRGHMTRREDPVWGSDSDASEGNDDSMHVTNAVPQMQSFNGGIWLRLEDYALDHAREDDMRISVFTGPFLGRNDPYRFGVKIPITFWKVIAFIHDQTGKLSATGYTMTQKSFLQEEEFVFGQHETHQRPIAEIERRAGITFLQLRCFDPLGKLNESKPSQLVESRDVRYI